MPDSTTSGASRSSLSGNVYGGQSYVVFGDDNGLPPLTFLPALNGSDGFIINGADNEDYSGRSVSGAGDVNGDGIDDFLVGSRFNNTPVGAGNDGTAYLVFGTDAGFAAVNQLDDLDATQGLKFEGDAAQLTPRAFGFWGRRPQWRRL